MGGGQQAEKAGQAAQKPRPDGLVRVTAGQQADPNRAAPEPERTDRPALPRAADLFALRAPRAGRGEDRFGRRQPLLQDQVATTVRVASSLSFSTASASRSE